MPPPDPRTAPWRPDLAAAHLKGTVDAAQFVEPRRMWVGEAVAHLYAQPLEAGAASADISLASQLVLGEAFDVYETKGGFAWGQGGSDGYVGYIAASDLRAEAPAAPQTITARTAHLYPAANIKSRPICALPQGARIACSEDAGEFHETSLGFLPKAHCRPRQCADPIAAAEIYLGVPYLWGGRSAFGLDCSALVQVMLRAAGLPCPRDSDLQTALGTEIEGDLRRGDLIFWKGHVGILQSPDRLLHANAHFMEVTSEPLAQAVARIAAAEYGAITHRRRVLEVS